MNSLRLFSAFLLFLSTSAWGVAVTEDEFAQQVDIKNEDCAHLALAAKRAAWSGKALGVDDPVFKSRLKNCSQLASRDICVKTRRILEGSSANSGKNLLQQCSGPEEARATKTALTVGQVVAACKLGFMAIQCLTGNLPSEPSVTDIPLRPITRPESVGGGPAVGGSPNP